MKLTRDKSEDAGGSGNGRGRGEEDGGSKSNGNVEIRWDGIDLVVFLCFYS